jgi:uncharacterized protein (DUF1015 family)
MATVKPFKAWRPKAEYVQQVASVPYDVISSAEARALSTQSSFSFLKVIRPEVDLDETISIYDDLVYQQGKNNLSALLSSEVMVQEEEEHFFIYQLNWKGITKTGVFACVSVKDYDNNVILKHELTRPDKEDDRTKHILAQNAHAEPVMMTFNADKSFKELMAQETQTAPLFKFTADDEVEHTIWKCTANKAVIDNFRDISNLYIADGHHRCASASRAAKELRSTTYAEQSYEFEFFPAVLFPMDELQILPYNRIIFNLPEGFLTSLTQQFSLVENASPNPQNKGDISLYLDGSWYGLTLPESASDNVESHLDVARLQEFILEPLLQINDQRRDTNISFVGGIHGIEQLEAHVDSGKADLAISLYPTSIEELVSVSDAGLLMPPKSTWFEPKLRSGLLIHTF